MRAIVFERNGGPEVLELQEVPDPSPGEGRCSSTSTPQGSTSATCTSAEGRGYGHVRRRSSASRARGVTGTGERVAWIAVPGSYAERVAAQRDALVPVPDEVSSENDAAALLQGMTAHYLASDSYPIEEGDWVVVHAAPAAWACCSPSWPRSAGAG